MRHLSPAAPFGILGKILGWSAAYLIECFVVTLLFIAGRTLAAPYVNHVTGNVTIEGPASPPQVTFACCEESPTSLDKVFSNSEVIPQLLALHASLAVAVVDLSADRARVVRRLNEAGIPLTAWIELPANQGYYMNADNASQAWARIKEFEQWSELYGLRWNSVGLDIEPNFRSLSALSSHKLRLACVFLRRSLDGGRILRAQSAYSDIVRKIQLEGYSVQTYQMPYVVDEREAGSNLVDRLLGTFTVHGTLEVLMLYSSFLPGSNSAIIWKLGPHAQAIAIGSTAREGNGVPTAALDWEEFSHDLIVAGHYTPAVGVYDLEGCVDQGFLPRLKDFHWNQQVIIPADAAERVTLLGTAAVTTLWTFSHLIYFFAAVFAADLLLIWRLRSRKLRHA